MAGKKKEVAPPPEKAMCPGIKTINGKPMDKNPPHETNKSLITRNTMCVFCRGVAAKMGLWYGIERNRPIWREQEDE